MIPLVDDNADDVYLTRHAFTRAASATEIVVARDGIEALDLLLTKDGHEPLRRLLVLLGIHMPRLGGLDILTHLFADPEPGPCRSSF